MVFQRFRAFFNLHTDECTLPAGNQEISRLSGIKKSGYFPGFLGFLNETGIDIDHGVHCPFEFMLKGRAQISHLLREVADRAAIGVVLGFKKIYKKLKNLIYLLEGRLRVAL